MYLDPNYVEIMGNQNFEISIFCLFWPKYRVQLLFKEQQPSDIF